MRKKTWFGRAGARSWLGLAAVAVLGSALLVSFGPTNAAPAKSAGTILKYDENHTTDSNGHLELNNIEWDSYNIVPQEGSGYTLNLSDPSQPVIVNPDSVINVTLNLSP